MSDLFYTERLTYFPGTLELFVVANISRRAPEGRHFRRGSASVRPPFQAAGKDLASSPRAVLLICRHCSVYRVRESQCHWPSRLELTLLGADFLSSLGETRHVLYTKIWLLTCLRVLG